MIKFCTIATFLLVLRVATTASAQTSFHGYNKENKRTNLGIGFEFKFIDVGLIKNYIEKVENVPLELRQIPSHPDDVWIYGRRQVIRTVPYDSVDWGSMQNLALSLSPELTVWRFRVRKGFNLTFTSLGGKATKSNKGSTREINQYGQPVRGYGTSLVYYNLRGESSRKFGWVEEADFDIGKGLMLIAGRSQTHYKLVAESGYDRFDALERYKTHEVANNQFEKRYFGLGWQPERHKGGPIGLHFVVGKHKTIVNLTPAGEGLKLQYGSPWFIGFGFSVHGLVKLM